MDTSTATTATTASRTRNGWQTIPDDILFLIVDIVDELDFLESDYRLPRLWEMRAPKEGNCCRLTRRVKPTILALRQTCNHWRTASLTRENICPVGVSFIRWDEAVTPDSDDAEKQVMEVRDVLRKEGGKSELEVLAIINTADGLATFTRTIIGEFSRLMRRLWVYPKFTLGKDWELPNFPRLKGLTLWGEQKLLPRFQESAQIPELLSLALWQNSSDKLLPSHLPPVAYHVTWMFLNLDMDIDALSTFHISSPFLTRLALFCTRSEQAAAGLRSITAPNLKELEIDLLPPPDDHISMEFDIEGVQFPKLDLLWLTSLPVCMALRAYEALCSKKLDMLSLKIRPTDLCTDHDYPPNNRRVEIDVRQLSIRTGPGYFPSETWETVLLQLKSSAKFVGVEELYLEVAWTMGDLKMLQVPAQYFDTDTLKRLVVMHDGALAVFDLGRAEVKEEEIGEGPEVAEVAEGEKEEKEESTSKTVETQPPPPPLDETSSKILSIPSTSLTSSLVLRCDPSPLGWRDLEFVTNLYIMVYDFSPENVQTITRVLRELRGGTPKNKDTEKDGIGNGIVTDHDHSSGPLATLRRATTRIVKTVTRPVRMAIAFGSSKNARYPELKSVTIHAVDPHPVRHTPQKVVKELKSLVKQRRKNGKGKGKGELEEIVLRLPPEEGGIGWFERHGVECKVSAESDYQKIPFEKDILWTF